MTHKTIVRLEASWRAALNRLNESESDEDARHEQDRWDRLAEAKHAIGQCLQVGCRETSEYAYCSMHDEMKVR